MAKKKGKQKTTGKKVIIPAEQGKSKVGYKNPPEEHQFPPGQSGNPNGPPKHRTNLWVWFCKYMNLTDKEIDKLKSGELTQAQQSALKLVEDIKAGKYSGSQRLARHVFDREEGRAVEHVIIGNEDPMSDQECEEIRQVLANNAK